MTANWREQFEGIALLSEVDVAGGFSQCACLRGLPQERDGDGEEIPEVERVAFGTVYSNPALKQLDWMESYDKLEIIIDPLDATKEYSEDLLQYVTVMGCLLVDGVVRFLSLYFYERS